ncbi:GNAT family N-acetyltransferase [Clostridium bovifaecis]|uniref:GNAT family N-acetyltransferase n=1 Tax=Clostridium bovifaecis TaxID=2184719 RepID=A0A6I6F8D7_9CLOT|nr:GNAT family N-acetyltransferase [Clostridium bovifaecis]
MKKIVWSKGNEEIENALDIRRRVFIEEQNVPEEIEIDDIDSFAEHIVIYEGDEPIATGRIFKRDDKFFLGRIAVLKEHRGKHFGEIVVKLLVNRGLNKGAEEIFIHAQTLVKEFYERLGFKSFGEKYYEAGIEHINMSFKK